MMFFGVLGVMLAAAWVGGIGVKTPADYFLAGRRLSWGLSAVSIVATELSVMTVLGLSASTFRGDWSYLQFFAGAAMGRVLVAFALVPVAHASGATTIYGWLRGRVGPRAGAASAALFFGSRLLATAVRMAVTCAAAAVLLGCAPETALALIAGVGALAVVWGGLRSAVWANAVQLIVIFGAGLLASSVILHRLEAGLDTALFVALAGNKLSFFSGWSSLWLTLGGSLVGALAAFGTDYDLMQRTLAAKTPGEGRLAMLAAIGGSLAALLVFMALGTLLFVYYKQNPGLALPSSPDGIYVHFIATAMPVSLRGAALAGLVLASIDLPLPALSAAFVEDVWRPLVGASSPASELWLARACAAVAALSLAALARVLGDHPGAQLLAVKIGVVAGGALLGIFALAFRSGAGRDRSAAAALALVSCACAGALVLSRQGLIELPFSWSWLVPLGASATYLLTFGLAPLLG